MAHLLDVLRQDNQWINENDIRVIHYAGYTKPWIHQLYHIEANRIWWEYAKHTPFYLEITENYINNTLADDRYKKEQEIRRVEFDQMKRELCEYIAINEELNKALMEAVHINDKLIERIEQLECKDGRDTVD